ncbi:MAG: GIY-YIG nuclease family protein [Formosimonas sp.]|jgi:hypothetical protein
MMESEFINLGFKKHFFCKGLRSISGEFSEKNRCGIYILNFENGEYYVGLAVDVVRRYAQHKKTYSDISFVSFKETARSKLAETEKETIHALEDLDKKLRNINIVSIVIGETDLDLVVPPEQQTEWLLSSEPISEAKVERFNFPELRQKYSSRFIRLQQHEHYDVIAELIFLYTAYLIPFPKSTEYSFWSVSCLPSPNQPFARFNISWQETMVLFEDTPEFEQDNQIAPIKFIYLSIWLCKSILEQHHEYSELEKLFSSFYADDNIHATGGKDQKRIIIELNDFYEFVELDGIAEAIKTFNLRLMRKGGCQWKRYHCFDLADVALTAPSLFEI